MVLVPLSTGNKGIQHMLTPERAQAQLVSLQVLSVLRYTLRNDH
jgi:hypothetical protein